MLPAAANQHGVDWERHLRDETLNSQLCLSPTPQSVLIPARNTPTICPRRVGMGACRTPTGTTETWIHTHPLRYVFDHVIHFFHHGSGVGFVCELVNVEYLKK